jgi:CRP-like cAMP-binding protein
MIEPEILAQLSLFHDATPEMLRALAGCATDVRFPADGVVFLAGSPPRGWFVIIEGTVRVVRATEGRQHVVHTEGPGGTLGEVPVFTGEVHPATGIASESTRCIGIGDA